MTASMNTWRRGTSSSRTTSFSASKSRPLDSTTSALVGASWVIRTWPSNEAPPALPKSWATGRLGLAPPRRPVLAPAPLSAPDSVWAISSALAFSSR